MEKKVKKRLALLVAEFFYCGRFPAIPGTMGSLASLLLWVPALYFSWPLWIKIGLLLALFFIGLWASTYGIAHYQKPDPKQVVIDEVVGQGLPLLFIDAHVGYVILAFILFRVFDILKPWPIKAIEHRFLNNWGLMVDDVIAGLLAALCIVATKYLVGFL